MKKGLLPLLIILGFSVSAQDIQKEINEQVWKPFMQTFNNSDTDGFMAVHSKDVVRSPRDSKTILNFDEYKEKQGQGDKRSKERGGKKNLELHFTERIANKDLAFDVGVYRTTYTNSQGQSRSSYGRFHVVLRKENGIWKILVDTDSSEGGTIGEKEFLAANSME